MEPDNDRNISNSSVETSLRSGERPLSPLQTVSPCRAKEEKPMLSHKSNAKRKELEIQNAELLQALNETEKVLQKNQGDPMLRLQEMSRELTRAKMEHSEEIFRHKKSEHTLNESLRQQRELAAHLMAIREEERTTVAREIHDELGQMLASLQLNVSLITLEYHDHDQLVSRAKAMEQLIASSILTVQRISSGLRPVMLDLLGLADAIEWQAQEFTKLAGIACKTIILPAEMKVERNLATAIYRIFQEALNNVMRHSGATHVHVYLLGRKGWLTLSVRDDGRGISEKEKKDILSLGIAGMRERAEAFGGKLRIFGSPQHGTSLFARMPLAKKEDRHGHQNNNSR